MSAGIMAKDRKAIERVRHDLNFESSRRMLAVTVDLDDAKRMLDLIVRLQQENDRLEREISTAKKVRR